MFTYLSFRGQFPILAWFVTSIPVMLFCFVIIGDDSARPGTEQDLQLYSKIVAGLIISDYIIGLLSLFSLQFYSPAKRRKIIFFGYLLIASPFAVWLSGSYVDYYGLVSRVLGGPPLFEDFYVRLIDGYELDDVYIDRVYYTKNDAKTIAAAKALVRARWPDDDTPYDEAKEDKAFEEFKGSLIEAEGVIAEIVNGEIQVSGFKPEYDRVLLSVKGRLSVIGENRISYERANSDTYRFSVMDFKEITKQDLSQSGYVLPFESVGLGYRDIHLFDHEGFDKVAISFAQFLEEAGHF